MKRNKNKVNKHKQVKRKKYITKNLMNTKKKRLRVDRIILCVLVLVSIITLCIKLPDIQKQQKEERQQEIRDIVLEVLNEQKEQELQQQKDEEEKRKQEEELKQKEEELQKQQEEAAKQAELAKQSITSRGGTVNRTTETTNKLTGYRITSYYPGDGCASTSKTGSGKTTANFSTKVVEGKTVYTYQNKIVVATATEELLKSGYNVRGGGTRQSDKHYFRYGDILQLQINGNWYEAIVLDSCGASMWQGEYRVDIFVPNSSNVLNAYNVTIKY